MDQRALPLGGADSRKAGRHTCIRETERGWGAMLLEGVGHGGPASCSLEWVGRWGGIRDGKRCSNPPPPGTALSRRGFGPSRVYALESQNNGKMAESLFLEACRSAPAQSLSPVAMSRPWEINRLSGFQQLIGFPVRSVFSLMNIDWISCSSSTRSTQGSTELASTGILFSLSAPVVWLQVPY